MYIDIDLWNEWRCEWFGCGGFRYRYGNRGRHWGVFLSSVRLPRFCM